MTDIATSYYAKRDAQAVYYAKRLAEAHRDVSERLDQARAHFASRPFDPRFEKSKLAHRELERGPVQAELERYSEDDGYLDCLAGLPEGTIWANDVMVLNVGTVLDGEVGPVESVHDYLLQLQDEVSDREEEVIELRLQVKDLQQRVAGIGEMLKTVGAQLVARGEQSTQPNRAPV